MDAILVTCVAESRSVFGHVEIFLCPQFYIPKLECQRCMVIDGGSAWIYFHRVCRWKLLSR